MSITEFYRMDPNNPGDWYSNPCRYFFPDRETNQIDIDRVRKVSWLQKDCIIVGGGGLIGNENFELLMDRVSRHPDELFVNSILDIEIKTSSKENKRLIYDWKERVQKITLEIAQKLDMTIGPRIIWGAGHNSRDCDIDSSNVVYPEYMKKFHLVGVRDYDTGYRWVPCPSCMYSGFDRNYEIKNEFVWFEHKKRLIDGKYLDVLPAPRMLNTGQNLDQILEFLGSAETVVTNSYHGVYWATLLKRKVICVPWGNKFNMFKHSPVMATEKNWHEKIEEAICYPDALQECRDANLEFFYKVSELMTEMMNG